VLQLVSTQSQSALGSAFLREQVSLRRGFESHFTFTIGQCALCYQRFPSFSYVCCEEPDGGFAFVLQGESLAALGSDCLATVDNAGLDVAWADTATTVACSGYAGISNSVGLVFSTARNSLWALDHERGAVALYVNGDMGPTTGTYGPARGVAQITASQQLDDGSHEARVVYSAAARMLYLYLDGSAEPTLWAPLDVDELQLGRDGLAWAGFTASSGRATQPVQIDEWRFSVTDTASAASQLLEADRIVARVGQLGIVHIDARDSCGLPLLTGGDTWQVSITDPDGESMPVQSTEDLDDGTYRVTFGPTQSGWHTLSAGVAAAAGGYGPSFAGRLYVDP